MNVPSRLAELRTALIQVASLVLFCASEGCVRQSQLKGGSFNIRDEASLTLLTPPELGARIATGTQESLLNLGSQPAANLSFANKECSIHTSLFSFSPLPDKPGFWSVQSPSAEGWVKRSAEESLAANWTDFVVQLAGLQIKGCFPKNMDSYAIQKDIVRSIPIPADQALLFFYALGGSGYVDLQPGLQIQIEQAGVTKDHNYSSATVKYQAVSLPTGGVTLQLDDQPEHRRTDENRLGFVFQDLPQRFKSKSFLRLFLERADTGPQGARHAMLLGATSPDDLSKRTRSIQQLGATACSPELIDTTCITFSEQSVSLLFSITVNGKTVFYAPSTNLGQLLDALPVKKQAKAYATVSVRRPTNVGKYASIEFVKTSDGTGKVILLNGDRVSWR